MTTNNTAEAGRTRRNLVVLVVALAMAVTLAGALVFRMDNPGMQAEVKAKKSMPADAMGQAGPDMDQVRQLMAELKEKPNDPHVLMELANVFMMMQAFDRAETFLDMAAKADPDGLDPVRGQGMLAFHRKEYDKAAERFEIVVAKDDKDASAFYNLGILNKYYLNDPDKAKAYFEKGLSVAGGDKELQASFTHELENHEQ